MTSSVVILPSDCLGSKRLIFSSQASSFCRFDADLLGLLILVVSESGTESDIATKGEGLHAILNAACNSSAEREAAFDAFVIPVRVAFYQSLFSVMILETFFNHCDE